MKRCILEYTRGLLEKTVFAVENESTIGRSPRNAVHLPDAEVSRFHALIRWEPQGWTLMDLGSRNGTFVNGEKIDRCSLKNGDLILLGQSQLRFLESRPSQEVSDLYETQELVVEERPSQEIQDQMGLVKTFLDALPVGVAIVNEAMDVLYGNKALPSAGAGGDFHGTRSLGEVLLCPVSQEGHGGCAGSSSCDDCPLLDAAGQVFGEGVSILGREVPWYKGGPPSEGYVRFSILTLPYRLTGQALALLSWEDITPQIQARQALERARADLERRVMERASELRESNLRLKQEVEERKAAESRLRRTEARFRLMAENSPFPLAMIDDQGRYI